MVGEEGKILASDKHSAGLVRGISRYNSRLHSCCLFSIINAMFSILALFSTEYIGLVPCAAHQLDRQYRPSAGSPKVLDSDTSPSKLSFDSS